MQVADWLDCLIMLVSRLMSGNRGATPSGQLRSMPHYLY